MDNAITCEPQVVYYPEASKAAFDAINEWRKTHYLYFDDNNVCKLGTCEEGSSLAPKQITWGDKVSERGRIQAGYNTYHLVNDMMDGNPWDMQNLASHGAIMCGAGMTISSTYAYIGSDETVIAEEVKRRALMAVEGWINSGLHVNAIAHDDYASPYGSVAVCSYNKKNGEILLSFIYTIDAADRTMTRTGTNVSNGYTIHAWDGDLTNELRDEILNCREIKSK